MCKQIGYLDTRNETIRWREEDDVQHHGRHKKTNNSIQYTTINSMNQRGYERGRDGRHCIEGRYA